MILVFPAESKRVRLNYAMLEGTVRLASFGRIPTTVPAAYLKDGVTLALTRLPPRPSGAEVILNKI
jgi:hypothetical protein